MVDANMITGVLSDGKLSTKEITDIMYRSYKLPV